MKLSKALLSLKDKFENNFLPQFINSISFISLFLFLILSIIGESKLNIVIGIHFVSIDKMLIKPSLSESKIVNNFLNDISIF